MESELELIITVADIIPAGYCATGARAFCLRHNLDWHEMVTKGISEKRLLACNDALVHKLIAQAKIRTNGVNSG